MRAGSSLGLALLFFSALPLWYLYSHPTPWHDEPVRPALTRMSGAIDETKLIALSGDLVNLIVRQNSTISQLQAQLARYEALVLDRVDFVVARNHKLGQAKKNGETDKLATFWKDAQQDFRASPAAAAATQRATTAPAAGAPSASASASAFASASASASMSPPPPPPPPPAEASSATSAKRGKISLAHVVNFMPPEAGHHSDQEVTLASLVAARQYSLEHGGPMVELFSSEFADEAQVPRNSAIVRPTRPLDRSAYELYGLGRYDIKRKRLPLISDILQRYT